MRASREAHARSAHDRFVGVNAANRNTKAREEAEEMPSAQSINVASNKRGGNRKQNRANLGLLTNNGDVVELNELNFDVIRG